MVKNGGICVVHPAASPSALRGFTKSQILAHTTSIAEAGLLSKKAAYTLGNTEIFCNMNYMDSGSQLGNDSPIRRV